MGELVRRESGEIAAIPWTHFYDMHSGGGAKEDFEHIFIQAPKDEALVIFYRRFGHSAERISCSCCGEDYSVSELDQGETPQDEMREYSKLYYESPSALLIPASDIRADERRGSVPSQGWVYL